MHVRRVRLERTEARDIDLVLKGHYDDPELLEASLDAIDDFAKSIWLA